jgi:hypothetical protein
MSNDYTDPSANTQAFQAWAEQREPETAATARNVLPMVLGVTLGVLAIVVVTVLVAFN